MGPIFAPGIIEGLLATLAISMVPICVSAVKTDIITIGMVRLAIAIFGLGVWTFFYKKRSHSFTPKQWIALTLIGLFFGTHWLTFFASIKISSAAIGAIGISTFGLHLTILNWIFTEQRPRLNSLIAITMAITGSYMIIPDFSIENTNTLGLILGIFSAFVYALVPILHQKNKDIPTSSRTLAQFTIALIFFAFFSPMAQWNIPNSDWPILIFMGVFCTLIGHGLWVRATTLLPAKTTSCIFYMGLPFTLLFEFLITSNPMSPPTLIGAALILTANLLNQKDKNHSKTKQRA